MANHVCGFSYVGSAASPGWRCYLPQVALEAHTTVLASLARTTLTQTFVHPGDTALPEVRYAFPLYDGVSVVGFECRVGADRVIRGRVRERQAAQAVYAAARARGETAGLLEALPSAADVWTTTVSRVPAGATLRVVVTYLGELRHDAGVDGLRFTLPTRLAPRYGAPPGELRLAATLPSAGQAGLRVVVDIDLADSGAQVTAVQSPSHQTAVTLGHVSTAPAATTAPSFQRASATLALGKAELDRDFVLLVTAARAGTPSAVLETHPALGGQRALMATLVPRFALPPEPRPEIVFVCDRSGSMADKMPDLRAALRLFVKALVPGARFNLCSFGSSHHFLWERSVPYTRESADAALAHVETFDADYGGTAIYTPLLDTFARRHAGANLEVFLLTDGEVWDHAQLFQLVREQVAASGGAARLFTLGIGTAVSHALVEGLARAGNGFAQAVSRSEDMTAKVGRMLKGATFPHISDYTLEVQYDDDDDEGAGAPGEETQTGGFEMMDGATADEDDDSPAVATPDSEATMEDEAPAAPAPISLFDPAVDVDGPPAPSETDKWDAGRRFAHLPALAPPAVLQTPCVIPALFPFHRTTVYLLLEPPAAAPRKKQRRPRAVVLRGTSPRHGPLELVMPVTALPGPGQTIHQLAARKAVAELEEGGGWVRQTAAAAGADGPELAEREGIRLSERYQVGSRWASFVAVEDKDEAATAADDPGPSPSQPLRDPARRRAPQAPHPVTRSSQRTSPYPISQHSRASLQGQQRQQMQAYPAAPMARPAPELRRPQPGGFVNQMNPQPSPSSPGSSLALQDYHMQLMMLEQQNKKRLGMGPGSQPPPPHDQLPLRAQQQQAQQQQAQQQAQPPSQPWTQQMQRAQQQAQQAQPQSQQWLQQVQRAQQQQSQHAFQMANLEPCNELSFVDPLQTYDVLNDLDFDFDSFLHDGDNARAPPAPQANRPPTAPAAPLQVVVRLQDFDGFWHGADADLRAALGWGRDDDTAAARFLAHRYAGGDAAAAVALAARHPDVVATAAVVVWLRTERAADRDTWELLVDKAVAWLRRQDRGVLAALGLLPLVGLA